MDNLGVGKHAHDAGVAFRARVLRERPRRKYGPGLMIGGGDFGVPAGALRPVVFQYQVSPAEQMWSTYDPTELALNTWYMVTGSFDGSSLRIYRNAAHVGEAPGSPPGTGACNLQVCRASDIYSGYLPAIVHGVRYYNFKLSGDQIEALYYRTAAVAGRYYPPAWHPLGKVTWLPASSSSSSGSTSSSSRRTV